jgi:UDP:flavonoid glycosyltransferase YjiC (YdhE family)
LLAPNIVFRNVSRAFAEQCIQVGVSPRKFTGVLVSPYLFIQPTVEGFEYPRPDLPPQVHFIGALLPDPPSEFDPPEWWDQIRQKTRPVVLVTQGTIATNMQALIAPTLRGLAHEDVLVIAAGVPDSSRGILHPVPDNAKLERFVPFKPLMPYVDVYITNGGFGGVQYALSNGIPIITAGTTEDKAEIGNRVAYSGAGINLKTNSPTPHAITNAVTTILTTDTHRRRATALQAELAAHDAPAEAADLLERLAQQQAPIHRTESAPPSSAHRH